LYFTENRAKIYTQY